MTTLAEVKGSLAIRGSAAEPRIAGPATPAVVGMILEDWQKIFGHEGQNYLPPALEATPSATATDRCCR